MRGACPGGIAAVLLTVSAIASAAAAADSRRLSQPGSWAYDGPGPCAAAAPHESKLFINTRGSGSSNAEALEKRAHRKDQRASRRDMTRDGVSVTLEVFVTLPACRRSGGGDRGPPYPVLVFFNGFQFRASYYTEYAERLASWQYAVVQYNTPLFDVIDDADELTFLGPLLDWLEQQNAMAGGFAGGMLDLDRLAVAGHSRGGKLATLHFATNSRVKAGYGVDPVDNTNMTPVGPDYPSAVAALNGTGLPMGFTGATRTSMCNPKSANYQHFYGVAGPGSWQEVVAGTGHVSFCDAGELQEGLELLCPGEVIPIKEAIDLALPPMTAWLDLQLRPEQQQQQRAAAMSQNGLQAEFMEWTAAEQAAGNITFAVKLASGSGAAIAGGQSAASLLQRSASTIVQHAAALL